MPLALEIVHLLREGQDRSRFRLQAAQQVFRRIVSAMRRLEDFPQSGRPGQVEGTRELVVPGLPYLVIYRMRAETVEILRAFHTSTDWPSVMN